MVETSEEYKLAKEAHVANCTGGDIFEINFIAASVVSSYLLWSALVKTNTIGNDKFIPQFIIFVIPILASVTIASDYAIHLTIGIATCSFILLKTQPTQDTKTKKEDTFKPYLTIYRAGTMILTCIAILAVDFQFFPRRFAKVETFGTSLMDVGVGSFVFSSGIVASRAYIKKAESKSMLRDFLKSIRSALPILILGFSRLFLTKSVNYQEHSSEYGLHWNFFFTLGFLPPFVTLIGFLSSLTSFFNLASIVAVAYQTCLCLGLQDWILNHPRVDLITANKEGICSFFGYLSIFLFGLQCGIIIFQQKNIPFLTKILKSSDSTIQLSAQLFLYSVIMWSIFGLWTHFFPAFYVSRQMANLPYIYWVIAFNLTLLSLIVFVQGITSLEGRGPSMLDSININGLFTFLLANILTGLTNLSIKTLYVNDGVAAIINTVYMLVVCLVPWIMWRRFNIRIKL